MDVILRKRDLSGRKLMQFYLSFIKIFKLIFSLNNLSLNSYCHNIGV